MDFEVEGAAFALTYSFPWLHVSCLLPRFVGQGVSSPEERERVERPLGFPLLGEFRVLAPSNLVGHSLAKCRRPSHSAPQFGPGLDIPRTC